MNFLSFIYIIISNPVFIPVVYTAVISVGLNKQYIL